MLRAPRRFVTVPLTPSLMPVTSFRQQAAHSDGTQEMKNSVSDLYYSYRDTDFQAGVHKIVSQCLTSSSQSGFRRSIQSYAVTRNVGNTTSHDAVEYKPYLANFPTYNSLI